MITGTSSIIINMIIIIFIITVIAPSRCVACSLCQAQTPRLYSSATAT